MSEKINQTDLANIDLHAYVDGELSADESASIESQLKTNPAMVRSIDEIREMKAMLQTAFVSEQDAAPDNLVSMVERDAKPKQKNQWWAMCASLVLGLFGGYLLSQNVSKPAEADAWIAQIANYQTMYTQQTLQSIAASDTGQTPDALMLGGALKAKLSIPDFSDSSLEFKRGQVLASGDQPLVQLAYLQVETGKPLALCITRQSVEASGFKLGRSNGVNYVVWSKDGLSYIVIGDFETAELTKVAQSADAQGVTSL